MNRLMKNTFIIILICFFILYNPSLAFSQGREYERVRAVAVPAGEGPLVGEEPSEYYIAAGDTIEVFVWRDPDLTRDVTIRPDGKLSYPLIGTIKAAGLTIDQLQNEIKEKMSEYIRYPEVTVTVKKFAGNKIIVLGAVTYPGIYTYSGTMTVLEAIAMAGDFTDEGKRESIIVVSDNLTERPKVKRINVLRVMREGTSKRDILLKPNDLVYVPRRFISDFNRFLSDIQPSVDRALSVLDLRQEIRAWYRHKAP